MSATTNAATSTTTTATAGASTEPTFARDVANLEHRFIDTNGIRLHAVVGGAEGAPLIVLLHGFPEIWLCWRHQFQTLMSAGFRVVAPDMRGYNTSDKPKRVADYRVSNLVDDVAGVVRAFAPTTGAHAGRAHVVAHDWGGVVSWHLAARRPDVVDKLVILNCPHPTAFLRRMRNLDQFMRMYYALFFQVPVLPERAIRRENFRVLRNIFTHQPKRPRAYDDDEIRAYQEAFAQPGALTAALNYYRAMGRSLVPRPRTRASTTAVHKKITAPTLVLWGLDDAVLPPDCLDGTDRFVEQLEIVRIPNCSHWVTHDAPDIVNRELLRFLA